MTLYDFEMIYREKDFVFIYLNTFSSRPIETYFVRHTVYMILILPFVRINHIISNFVVGQIVQKYSLSS